MGAQQKLCLSYPGTRTLRALLCIACAGLGLATFREPLEGSLTVNRVARQVLHETVTQPFVPEILCTRVRSEASQDLAPHGFGVLEPSSVDLPGHALHRLRGVRFLYQGDYDAAHSELSQISPGALHAYFMGCAEIGLKNYDHGLALWQATSLPAHPYVRLGAYLLQKEKRPLDALPFFEVANRIAPDNPSILVYLSHICGAFLGNQSRSLEYIERAAVLEPDDWVVMVTLGSVRSAVGDWAGAIDAFRKATAVSPRGGPRPYTGLARALVVARQDERGAMITLAQGLEIWPNERSLFEEVAQLYTLLGRQAAAQYWQQQAESLAPDPLPGEFLAGMDSFYAGDCATARLVFDNILATYPDHSGASTWLHELVEGEP